MNRDFVIEHLSKTNKARMKILSLFMLAFSVFILVTDYFFDDIWSHEHLYAYRVMDIIIFCVSIATFLFYWFFKKSSPKTIQFITFIVLSISIHWAAIITGIEVGKLGYTTFLTVLMVITFFFYLNFFQSIFIFISSCIVLFFVTIYMGKPHDELTPFIVMVIPIVTITVIVSNTRRKNFIKNIENTRVLEELNKKLLDSNEHLEEEVRLRTREILIAKEKAEESDKLKSAFLNSISHEFRTPMNGIMGFADMLILPNSANDNKKLYAEKIKESSKRLLELVTDTVDISKINSKTAKQEIYEIEIADILEKVKDEFASEIQNKGLILTEKEKCIESETKILSDEYKIYRAIWHITSNAVKFTKEGEIELSCRKLEDKVEIKISDAGIGIEEKHFDDIFQPFFQIDYGLNRRYDGIGVGLYIAKSYIEDIGGTISLESELGKGTSFYVEIPNRIENL